MEPTVKKRKLQAIETKQRIYDVTMELIDEKGVENVQIEEISRKANISMGLFYKYYSNIYDVMSETRSQECDAYYRDVRNNNLSNFRGEEKLIKFIEYVFEFHKNHLCKVELKHSYATILTHDVHRQSITNEDRTLYIILAECLEEMKEDGVLTTEASLDSIVLSLSLLIRGSIFEYILNDDSFDFMNISLDVVKTYLRGLK